MYFILVAADNSITEVLDGDRVAKPPAAITITDEEARLIATSPRGHVDFDYINGAVVPSTDRINENELRALRHREIQEIRREGVRRIREVDASLDSESAIRMLIFLWTNNVLDTTEPGADILHVKAIYQYMAQKISQARGATKAQLLAYNAATDPNWP